MKNFLSLACIGAALLCPTILNAQLELFISEIADPADEYSGRFVELYNAGEEEINFAESIFYLSRQSNGGDSWGEVQLSGIVNPRSTFTIGGSSFASLYGFEPDLVSGILTGNGDDAYVLYFGGDHSTGTVQDIYGERDIDGTGAAWEYVDSKAERNTEIGLPSSIWMDEEWTIENANLADCSPGLHEISGQDQGGDSISIVLSVEGLTVDIFEPFSLSVRASEIALQDSIIAYQFSLSYDSLVLQYIGYSIDSTLSQGGTVAINDTQPGSISIGCIRSNPIYGNGILIDLHFTASSIDTSEVILSDAFFNTSPFTGPAHGIVIVGESTPPLATLLLSDTMLRFSDTLNIEAHFSESMSSLSPVYLILNGLDRSDSVQMNPLNDSVYEVQYSIPKWSGSIHCLFSGGSDQFGNPLDSVPVGDSEFYIYPFRLGDVDDDGNILAYDAAIALQYSVGIDPIPEIDAFPWEPWRVSTANVDAVGEVTAYDAGLILQYSVGILSFENSVKKEVQTGNVYFELNEDTLYIYSEEELIGLNLNITGNKNLPGVPVLLSADHLLSYLFDKESLSIGLCTHFAPEDSTSLLKIPISSNSKLKIKLIENTEYREEVLNLATHRDLRLFSVNQVYPNPASSYVEVNSLDVNARIELINSQGQIEKIDSQFGRRIDISHLPSGLYFLRIRGEARTVYEKLIIE